MSDDFLGMAVVPLSTLLFAEEINPFKGMWAPTNIASIPSGATSSSYQPVQRAQALFRAPVILGGVPKGFLRGHIVLQQEPPLLIESLWEARGMSLHHKHWASGTAQVVVIRRPPKERVDV